MVDLLTLNLLLLDVVYFAFFLDRHLLLKLHKLLLKLVLVHVHVVVSRHHLVKHIRLHLHLKHLILQLIQLVNVHLLKGFLLRLNRPLQPFILHNTLLTIYLWALAAYMLNTPCWRMFWCAL